VAGSRRGKEVETIITTLFFISRKLAVIPRSYNAFWARPRTMSPKTTPLLNTRSQSSCNPLFDFQTALKCFIEMYFPKEGEALF